METLKDKTAIVGIGHTEYSRDSGRSEMSLAVEAIRNAITDAGLKPTDIDGIAKFSMDNNDHVFLAANLGIPVAVQDGLVNLTANPANQVTFSN